MDNLEELSAELKTLKDAIQGVPEAIAEMQKKSTEEIAKLETEYKARYDALCSANAPKRDDRDEGEKEKEGTFDWGAMFKGVGLKSKFGTFADAARHGTDEGTKARKDADFTVERVMKAMSTTAGSGGYHVPEEWATESIEQLYANMVTIAAGIKQIGYTDHTVRIPALTTSVTGYWIAEGGSITASDQADSQETIDPKEASAFTVASNQLLTMSNPDQGKMIKDDMIQTLGRLIDLAVLRGSGTSNQPTGIASTGSIGTVTASGALTWALLEQFPRTLDYANAPNMKRAFIMHPRTHYGIRQLTSSNTPIFVGTPQAQPMTTAFPGGIVGYPSFTTTQIPITGGTGSDAEVYFCDWNDIVLANWGTLEIIASSESGSAFQQNQTHIRAIHLVDVLVRHAASCVLCDDTTT